MTRKTTYEQFEESADKRRLLRQEELILDATEALTEALHRTNTSRSDLAKRLKKTKSFVSQLFNSGRNLTMRTMADVADALGYRVRITLEPNESIRFDVWEGCETSHVVDDVREDIAA